MQCYVGCRAEFIADRSATHTPILTKISNLERPGLHQTPFMQKSTRFLKQNNQHWTYHIQKSNDAGPINPQHSSSCASCKMYMMRVPELQSIPDYTSSNRPAKPGSATRQTRQAKPSPPHTNWRHIIIPQHSMSTTVTQLYCNQMCRTPELTNCPGGDSLCRVLTEKTRRSSSSPYLILWAQALLSRASIPTCLPLFIACASQSNA
jgi:hypothetical protein